MLERHDGRGVATRGLAGVDGNIDPLQDATLDGGKACRRGRAVRVGARAGKGTAAGADERLDHGQRWVNRIPATYREAVLNESSATPPRPSADPYALALLKHYRSLMPMAMDARKPMFALRSADGAIGSHIEAVRACYDDFLQLAQKVASHAGLAIN